MELIEGPTLADRTATGPLSLKETLAFARQIADALDVTHEKGIVHRDLKPANIKVTADSVVKVLDFGLAKAGEAGQGGGSDAITIEGTREGIVLGTAAYMSPEQARGQAVDKRTDIWAFGCVLYEMLTGRAAFARGTITDTLAAIVERDPDWSALPANTPAAMRRILRRCLEKDRRHRLRDIADAAGDLDDTEAAAAQPKPVAEGRSRRAAFAAAIGVVLLATLGTTLWSRRGTREAFPASVAVMRTTVTLSANQKLATADSDYPMALSPDGTRFAYVAEQEGQTQLYVRELSALEPRAIPGTTGARHPFFSPDGEWIGFFADGALQRVAASGGAPLRITKVSGVSMGAAWGPDDTIVWASRGSDLMKIKAGGSVPQPFTGSKPAAWPEILPDGKTILFTTGTAGEGSAIAAMSLGGGEKRIIARTIDSRLQGPAVLGAGAGIAQVRFVPSGSYLVYGQSQDPGSIRALPFNPVSLTAAGSPLSLVSSVERSPGGGAVYFAVAKTGLLLYASTGDRHQLVWVDRNGTVTPISADRAAFRDPQLSPDGTRIAVTINDETRRSDVWVYDAQRGNKRRLTTEYHNLAPVWTADGRRITFSGGGLVGGGVVELSADASGTREILLPVAQARTQLPAGTTAYPVSWSPDGRDLLFQADAQDLWVLPRGAKSSPRLVQSKAHDGRFSPDGQWVVYTFDGSGRGEIYVSDYPEFARPFVVSKDGGAAPRWSRDGREIFYRQGDALMAVSVQARHEFHAEKPRRLFSGRFSGVGHNSEFDVSPDGRRFVMIKSDEASTLTQLTAVQNLFEDLKRSATK
jgi:serine/threonine-protein kinase